MARDEDAIELLRYWLRCIRTEEALASRPRAERTFRETAHVDLLNPVSEREYFKISQAEAAALLDDNCKAIERPLDAESAAFFEAWLAGRYRYEGSDIDGPEMMVLCPTVHLPRGLLSGVIRFGVSVVFLTEENRVFEVPKRSARRRGALPNPPTRIRIERLVPEEGPPFYLDPRLLAFELGVLPEELERFQAATLPRDAKAETTVARLHRLASFLFDSPNPDDTDDPDAALGRLFAATFARLRQMGGKARCYNVALVSDASRFRATAYLQKEMEALIRGELELRPGTPLHAYLTRTPLSSPDSPIEGLMPSQGISPSQKRAVSRCIASDLAAVQGPPGTGKTTLILHLAAHRLVTRIARYVKTGAMPSDITAVVSTNNRAVDNAMERTESGFYESEMPSLVLRTGNRRVCETQTAFLVRAAADALSGVSQTEPERSVALKDAVKKFKAIYNKLEKRLAPEKERAALLIEKQRLETAIAQLASRFSPVQLSELQNGAAVNEALAVLRRLERNLFELSRSCEKRATPKTAKNLIAHCNTATLRLTEKAARALKRLGNDEVELFTAPKSEITEPKEIFALYEDAAETGLDRTQAEISRLETMLQKIEASANLLTLTNALASLHIPDVKADSSTGLDLLRYAAFEAALAVRNAHLAVFADTYSAKLRTAAEKIEGVASMRRLRPELRRALQEVFPIWGCTLLSLGNVFDETEGGIDRVIIDEAGQCHPAYAISALVRCRSAAVLGDVHQLTPVYTLSEAEERPLRRTAGRPLIWSPSRDVLVFDKSTSSVQYLAERATLEVERLTDHFRSQPKIIEISNRLCGYGLVVHTEPKSRAAEVPFLTAPVLLLDTPGEAVRNGGSRLNQAEAHRCVDLLHRITDHRVPPEDIAVITPYRAQLHLLRRRLADMGIPVERSDELLEESDGANEAQALTARGVAVGTVHRFQGGERSIVLFSTVVSDPGHLGFLNGAVNLLNVAVSRAADHLVVVGNEPVLRVGTLTRMLLTDAQPVSSDRLFDLFTPGAPG